MLHFPRVRVQHFFSSVEIIQIRARRSPLSRPRRFKTCRRATKTKENYLSRFTRFTYAIYIIYLYNNLYICITVSAIKVLVSLPFSTVYKVNEYVLTIALRNVRYVGTNTRVSVTVSPLHV